LLVAMLSLVALGLQHMRFPQQELLSFGFTPSYLAIVATSLDQGAYTSHLEGMTNGALTGAEYRIPLAESQREPLYPAVLMLSTAVFDSPLPVVWLQRLALAVAIGLVLNITLRNGGYLACSFCWALIVATPVPFFYSQILYPYAFQVVTLIGTLIALSVGSKRHALIAGVLMAFTIHERGMYLLLPPLLAIIAAWKRQNGLAIASAFLITCIALSLPWLVRNASVGATGMNQMSGYALGYTFGDLPGGGNSIYDDQVAQYGTDAGTLRYIGLYVEQQRTTWAAADQAVAAIVVQKMAENPSVVVARVLRNLALWPSRLAGTGELSLGERKHIVSTYIEGIGLRQPSKLDGLWLLAGLVGVGWAVRQGDRFASLAAGLILYVGAVTTTIVVSDPRYRGCLDLIMAAFSAQLITRLFRVSLALAKDSK
jgi:hypothetical protein